jgi:hypothetical protein
MLAAQVGSFAIQSVEPLQQLPRIAVPWPGSGADLLCKLSWKQLLVIYLISHNFKPS